MPDNLISRIPNPLKWFAILVTVASVIGTLLIATRDDIIRHYNLADARYFSDPEPGHIYAYDRKTQRFARRAVCRSTPETVTFAMRPKVIVAENVIGAHFDDAIAIVSPNRAEAGPLRKSVFGRERFDSQEKFDAAFKPQIDPECLLKVATLANRPDVVLYKVETTFVLTHLNGEATVELLSFDPKPLIFDECDRETTLNCTQSELPRIAEISFWAQVRYTLGLITMT